jgi:hypothetical protein
MWRQGQRYQHIRKPCIHTPAGAGGDQARRLNRLVSANWNGYGGNFGGLSLCCVTKNSCCTSNNRIKALAEEDAEHEELHQSSKSPTDSAMKSEIPRVLP